MRHSSLASFGFVVLLVGFVWLAPSVVVQARQDSRSPLDRAAYGRRASRHSGHLPAGANDPARRSLPSRRGHPSVEWRLPGDLPPRVEPVLMRELGS